MRLSSAFMIGLVVCAACYGVKVGAHRPDKDMALLPPPPAMTSPEAQEDWRIYNETRLLLDTPRWEQAVHDAEVNDFETIQDFLEAAQITLSRGQRQEFIERLESIEEHARAHMMREKAIWQRRRPFIDYGGRSCVIDHRRFITSWSYPSGHTVRGYTIALILGDLFPKKKTILLAKAHDFAESRVICGMHWASDIKAGEIFAYRLFEEEKKSFLSMPEP